MNARFEGVLSKLTVDGDMERTAAVALHSALIELLSAAQPDEELASIWAESIAATVNARFQGVSGKLTVEPPMVKFSADTSASEAADGARDSQEWLLVSFSGVIDDEAERERCELRLLQQEEDDGLLFGFQSAVELVRCERTLRTAASGARAAVAALGDSPARTAAPLAT